MMNIGIRIIYGGKMVVKRTEALGSKFLSSSSSCTFCSLWLWQVNLSTKMGILLVLVKVKVTQSHPTLCDPMDYTVHGILQVRILEWVAFPFSRGSSQPRDWTQISCIAGRFFTDSYQGSPDSTDQYSQNYYWELNVTTSIQALWRVWSCMYMTFCTSRRPEGSFSLVY